MNDLLALQNDINADTLRGMERMSEDIDRLAWHVRLLYVLVMALFILALMRSL